MFGPPGSIYVFLSYGVHWLLNFVCDEEAVGSAVLVRAFEPVGDVRGLQYNRGIARAGPLLSCGPGRVGQALGVGPELNGRHLGDDSGLFVVDAGGRPSVGSATRVGISRGGDLALRYYMTGSAYVTGGARTGGGNPR